MSLRKWEMVYNISLPHTLENATASTEFECHTERLQHILYMGKVFQHWQLTEQLVHALSYVGQHMGGCEWKLYPFSSFRVATGPVQRRWHQPRHYARV